MGVFKSFGCGMRYLFDESEANISVWNASQQKKIYGRAWGMIDDVPESVGNINMTEGMPYFISPEAEFNVTWVGSVPQHATFELKVPEGWTSGAKYII